MAGLAARREAASSGADGLFRGIIGLGSTRQDDRRG
jgi:hypothetical protein